MSNNKNKTNLIFALISLLSIFLLSTLAFAIPNSLSIQGKLTNQAGASQQGTFNFTFRIYDNMTAGNTLWELVNYNITTDANGVYDIILNKINVSFADQLYLGIAVGGDNESIPRINLTSAPYSFRANTSEALNPNASYFVTNLSISGHTTIGNGSTSLLEISTTSFNLTTSGNIKLANNITIGDQIIFRFSQVIDNLVNGFLRISGNLNVTGNTSIAQNTLFVDNTSGKVGIGTTSPNDALEVAGNVRVSGSLNSSFINATVIKIGTKDVQASGDFDLRNISNNTLVKGDNASIGLWNVSSGNVFLRDLNNSVGIGTLNPGSKLTVVGGINATGGLNVTAGNVLLATTSGNVGIGTSTPSKKLAINGTTDAVLIDPSATPNPVVNTTGNNLTISSASGSIIIRLG